LEEKGEEARTEGGAYMGWENVEPLPKSDVESREQIGFVVLAFLVYWSPRIGSKY